MDTAPNLDKIIKTEADKDGEVYIVTSEDKMNKFQGIGEIVFKSERNAKTNFSVVILKVKKE
jgi:hypothetical protein